MCGITRVEDLIGIQTFGVDAVGFVLFPKSRRAIDLSALEKLAEHLTPFVTPVLLFVNPTTEEVKSALKIVPNALLQFHGNEEPDFCRSFKQPWIKAVAVKGAASLSDSFRIYSDALSLLADTPSDGWGGSGMHFDWSLVDRTLSQKIILAGGLNAQNVGKAVSMLRPYAVDVSTGVEDSPGVKNIQKVKEFVSAVQVADAM